MAQNHGVRLKRGRGAYAGQEPFIFISYAHKDGDLLTPILERLMDDGYRVWYDEGIDPGTEWDSNIAEHIEDCAYFIAFLSENYLASDNCKDELGFVRDLGKPRLLVYLEDVKLPAGMRMRLGRLQAIHKYTYAEEQAFYDKLYAADGISVCKGKAEEKAENPVVQYDADAERRRKDEERRRFEAELREKLMADMQATLAKEKQSTADDALAKLKQASAGDYVTFGAYRQSGSSNGKEKIEWLVLDKKDGKILVISKYALDCQPYNKDREYVTWQTSSLRTWLNNDFLQAAFSPEERAMIPTVTVPADKNPSYSTNPGNATQDQVFLLSIPEAKRYFGSSAERQCKPTKYVRAQGAVANGNCWWWLRSPGFNEYNAAYVRDGGAIGESGQSVYFSNRAVRPALWIDLNS